MKRTLTLIALIVLLVSANSFAQAKELTDNQLQTLVTGIKSDNLGLKRSSIFFAGYYKLSETVDVLKDEMLNAENADIQILAALALYEIGDDDVMVDLNVLAKNKDEDYKVRRMAQAIYEHWVNESNFVSVAR